MIDLPTDGEPVRLRRAKAQADLLVDVLCSWRGRYEDDDRRADIGWIQAVIPEVERRGEPGPDFYRAGWLCVDGTTTPGIGWKFEAGKLHLASLCRSFRGVEWCKITRRIFRIAARNSGVTLPSRHATLYLVTGGPLLTPGGSA